ncbi:hypothetical protein AMS68_003644 [Peltaster fructicola]|uniref:DEAD/DEAH box helicase domain-containing protein n=1 Tax=Peltaster fructicola TaxID=286661 RepID=A0A6H0XTN1_9PEZI|nr:hypothetical protein AMS68_003644 [Peltaster fructicola]
MPGDVATKRNARANIDFTLRRVFGKQSFRPTQREAIEAALDGNDVYLQAATSFGKAYASNFQRSLTLASR